MARKSKSLHRFDPSLIADFLPCVCRKAKLLLKKKRYLEGLLGNTDTQLENLQQMVDTIEFTQIEVKVVDGLKQGNEALNQLHKVCRIYSL